MYWKWILSAILSVNLSITLTLIVVSTVIPIIDGCWSSSTNLGEMTPDQKLLSGSRLSIDCSLNNNTIYYENQIHHVNSSMIGFKFDGHFYDSDRIQLVDDRVARLEVEKASVSDNGMYYCMLNIKGLNHRPLVCLTHVTVGYKPEEVSDFKCISLHFRKLHCSWIPPNNPIQTTYILEDRIHPTLGHLARKCGNIPSDNSCEWTTDSVPPYRNTVRKFYLFLIGTNQLGEYERMYVIDHYSIIKPNVVQNFVEREVTTTGIGLSWRPPEYIEHDDDVLDNIIYEIRYFNQITDKSYEKPKTILDGIRETSFNLTDLVPYLKYNISIRCKTLQSKGDQYWSQFSSIVVQTKSDVPYLAPELIPQSFQTDKNMEELRSITLFWKQIAADYRNGPDFRYLIKFFPIINRKSRAVNLIVNFHDTQQIESPNTTYTFNHMKSDTIYEFQIYGLNSIGKSSNFTKIVIPTNEVIPHKPSNIDVYSYGGGRYEVKWTEPRINHLSGDIVNYTVFWCQNLRPRPFPCEGPIDWMPTKNTSITLELPDIGTNYQFAVAANAIKASSGMSWAECVVPIDGRVDKLREVQLKVQNSTSIVTNWKLNCPAQKSLIEYYILKYCSINGSLNCVKTESVSVHNSAENYTIDNLEPFTRYRITVTPFSDSGPSEESDPRYETTFHDSPEDAPSALEVTEITAHTISLMWKHPIKPNGHISHYNIDCNERRYTDLKADTTCNSSYCSFTINNLQSYVSYQIRVRACNSESLCSPDSKALPALTLKDIPFVMDPPRYELINSTAVRISWSPPIPSNGPIDNYLMRLIRSDNTTEVFNISGKIRDYMLKIDCDSMEVEDNTDSYHSQYSVQMSSENILEDGYHLTSDFSQTTNLNACIGLYSATNFNYIVGIIVGGAFGLLILVVVLVHLTRWMKRKIISIRNLDVELPQRLEHPALVTNPYNTDAQPFDHFDRSDSSVNIGLGPLDGDNSFIKNRHDSALSQTSNDSTEYLYNKTTTKASDKFYRMASTESGQHESVSSTEAHTSSDSGTENDIQIQNNDLKDGINNVHPLSILDENASRNSDSSDSKDSGLDVNSNGVRNKKSTNKRKSNIKTSAKLSTEVKPTPDTVVFNPLYDKPMNHSVCVYSLLANSEPSLLDIPVREDDNILSDLTKFSKPEMAKSLSNIIQNYSPFESKVNCIICETNNSSRCSTRTSSPNCPYYKYGIKRQNHNQSNFVPTFSPDRKKAVNATKANNGYITIDSILQNGVIGSTVVPNSSKKKLEHDWSQNSYDAEVSSTSSNGDNEQTDVLLAPNNCLAKSLSFTESEKIQNKIQNNPSIEDNTELNLIDSSVYPLNTSSTDLVTDFEPQLNAIKEINNPKERTPPVKTSPTHFAKDSNGYVLHNALNQLSAKPLKQKLTKNANGYVVLEAVDQNGLNGIEMTDYVPNHNVVNHMTQV